MQEQTKSATREEEQRELESVLASPVFRRAPGLSRILAYVCEQYFAGKAASIKEYNIAVEGLGRTPDFSASQDSIVRVEFGRLRKRLHYHYETSGRVNGLRIKLPDAGYIPKFEVRPKLSAAEANNGHAKFEAPDLGTSRSFEAQQVRQNDTPPHRRLKVLLALGLVSLVFAALLYRLPSGGHAHVPRFQNLFAKAPSGSSTVAAAPCSVAGADAAVRICAGGSAPRCVDAMGRVWLSDRYFTGGVAISRRDRRILRTLDPFLYRNAREGDFCYDDF
jgi:hypothetical protein